MRVRASLAVAAVAAALGCGSDDRPPLDPDGYDAAIVWEPCPFFTGGSGAEASCARVPVPLDWRDPGGDRIELFVKRLGAGDGVAIWFLQGGPGGAANAYEGFAQPFLDADPSLDIYLLDHRGVGRSSRLGCAAEESTASEEGRLITAAEWPACLDSLLATHGDDLAQFNTTNAATDLGWLIGKTRAPGQPVHVHGTSYGTRWAHRYLQIFPEQPTSVSLLGVVDPEFDFAAYDLQYEQVGAELMAACAADDFCRGKLGADPEAVLRAALADIPATCPAAAAQGVTREAIRRAFASKLLFSWHRAAIPAVAYRLDRCSAADVDAIAAFVASAPDAAASVRSDPLFSQVINMHIGLAELWQPTDETSADHADFVAGAAFAFGGTARYDLADVWPIYPPDEYSGRHHDSAAPILAHEGELDPASPLARARIIGDRLTGPHQHFVVIPGGTHSFASPTPDGWDCALNQMFSFVRAPTEPLLDCIGDVLPLDFRGDGAEVGAADLWEN